MSSEIIEVLSEYISKEMLKRPGLPLRSSDPLISTGLIDSFHLVDLAMFVESKFGVVLDDMELNASTFDTLEELAELIQRKKRKQ